MLEIDSLLCKATEKRESLKLVIGYKEQRLKSLRTLKPRVVSGNNKEEITLISQCIAQHENEIKDLNEKLKTLEIGAISDNECGLIN